MLSNIVVYTALLMANHQINFWTIPFNSLKIDVFHYVVEHVTLTASFSITNVAEKAKELLMAISRGSS